MNLNKSNMKKIMILIAFTVLLLVGVWKIDGVVDAFFWAIGILQPFLIGGCIAFVLLIPVKMFERVLFKNGTRKHKWLNKISRPISILLGVLFVFGIVLFVVFIIAPELGNTINLLVKGIPDFVANAQEWVLGKMDENPQIQEFMSQYTLDWAKISDSLIGITKTITDNIVNSISAFVGGLVSTITTFLIGFVFAIYLLANREKLSIQCKKILYGYLPVKRADRILIITRLTSKTFANYVSGQCMEAVILGTMFFVTLTVFRYPYALLIGVLVAFTALIPILGAYVGSAISVLLIFMVNPIQALWFIVIFNVLQQIEGNLIYPHVVGGSVGLPSLWVLFAVTVGGSLMGVFGMIIFIPIISVIYTLLRENVNIRLMVRHIPPEKYKN